MHIAAEAVLIAAASLFVVAMVWGALSDVARFEIPNWISLAVAAAFVPAAFAAGLAPAQVAWAVAVAAACLIVGVILFVFGLFGGGDVKLLAAAAIWVGNDALPSYLVLVALAGGALSLALIVFRRLPLPARLRSAQWLRRLHARDAGVPYGVAIAAAALAVMPRLDIVAPLASGGLAAWLSQLA